MPILLSLILMIAPATSRADSPACQEKNREIEAWWPDSAAQPQAVPQAKMTRALELLATQTSPSADELTRLRRSLETNFSKAVDQWFSFNEEDCSTVRMRLARALINTTRTDPKSKPLIASHLAAVLRAPKYPNLLAVMIDIVTAEEGEKAKLWSNQPTRLPSLEKLHAAAKKDVKDWGAKYDRVFNDAQKGPRTAEQLTLMKEGILKELALVELHSKELNRLTKDL